MRVRTGGPSIARRGAWLGAFLAAALIAVPRHSAGAGSPLPVVFEANQGQADPRVKFLARGAGYILFVTTTEAVLTDRQSGHAVRMRLLGARPDLEVTSLEPLPGRIHYLRGRNPARWRTGCAHLRSCRLPRGVPGDRRRLPNRRGITDRAGGSSFVQTPIPPRSASSSMACRA
ncbi:MAG: hypothetical protein ACRDHY_07530 [Anaerolineales bacterium]